MAALNIPFISVDDFLDHEERSETKNFYYVGVITAIAGGSPGHSFLAANLIRHLGNALQGKGAGWLGVTCCSKRAGKNCLFIRM